MITNIGLVPSVVEKRQGGYFTSDLFSNLLEKRIVMCEGEVSPQMSELIIAQLLYLNSADSVSPIYLYINSPGGSVIDGMAIVDTMNFISAPVYTIVTGMAASMGSVILSAGTKRYALPNAKVLVHPMSGGTQGRTQDNLIENNYEKRLEKTLLATLAHNCKRMSDKAFEEIYKVVDEMEDKEEFPQFNISEETKKELDEFRKEVCYDHWLTANQALRFGIIDKVLKSESEVGDDE